MTEFYTPQDREHGLYVAQRIEATAQMAVINETLAVEEIWTAIRSNRTFIDQVIAYRFNENHPRFQIPPQLKNYTIDQIVLAVLRNDPKAQTALETERISQVM